MMKGMSRIALLNSAAVIAAVGAPAAARAEGAGMPVRPVAAAQQTDDVKPAKRVTKQTSKKEAKAERVQEPVDRKGRITAADIASGDDITVIGTLIAGSNATANAPVTTVDKEYLVDHGLGRIEDTFGQMPQVAPGLGLRGSESWTQGSNGINLRGLGASRTLVLVNGERASNDMNNIPTALLKKAEILTGGASTVYGSDAIAGVVNFTLNRKFNGIQFDMENSGLMHKNDNQVILGALAAAKYPTPPRNFFGGFQQYATLAGGKSILGGRVNVSGSVAFRRTLPIRYSQYDTGGCPLYYNDPNKVSNYITNSGYYCGTSDYNPYGYFRLAPPGATAYSNYSVAKDGGRAFTPYDPANDSINHATDGYLQRGDDSTNANLFVSTDLFKDVKLDTSLFYSRYNTTGQETQTGNYYATNPSTQSFNFVNCDNPFLSASQATLLCGINAGKSGQFGRLYAVTVFRDSFLKTMYYHNTEWRNSISLYGTLVDKVRFRISYQRTRRDESYGADGIYDYTGGYAKLQRVLNVVNVDGVPTCVAKINGTDPNCVPADVFAAGTLSPKVFDYLSSKGNSVSNSGQQVARFNLSGTLDPYGIKSPFATAGVGFAVFGEWRRNTSLSQGFGAFSIWTNFRGIIDVKESGGEISVPLIQDKPFFKDFTVNGGIRRSKYAGYSQVVNSWKADATWSPFDGLRFRGSYNRAIRVPVKEQLEAQNLYPGRFLLDLCAPPGKATTSTTVVATRYTFAQCAVGGLTQQQYDALTNYTACNAAGQCPATLINGGNPGLLPERSRSVTAGVVVQPRILRGFLATIDYYDINITNALAAAEIGYAFQYCYNLGIKAFCDMYKRDPNTGVLLLGDARYVNSNIVRTRGFDINVTQNLNTNWKLFGMRVGGFSINAIGNRTLKYEQGLAVGAPVTDCMGYFGFGCGTRPVWRSNTTFAWRIPGDNAATLAFTWRHISGLRAGYLSNNIQYKLKPSATDSGDFPLLRRFRPMDYFDAAFNMNVNKNLSIRLNAQNLLDRDPPLAAQGTTVYTGASNVFNTYPGYYEMLGRTVRFGITMRQ